MKEEILVLLLGITALALVTVHAYKELTTPVKTKVVVKWYNYNF